MTIFGRLEKKKALSEVVNFETFFSSFCLLFRIATAAGWNGIYDAACVKPPLCVEYAKFKSNGLTKGTCGNTTIAIVYFVSYILLFVLIIINMYIAVILENFNQAQSLESGGITEEDIDCFYEVWKQFDTSATQFINFKDLPIFLTKVDPPFEKKAPENYKFLKEQNIATITGNKVHCLDVLMALIRKKLGDQEDTDDFQKVMDKVESKFRSVFPKRRESTPQGIATKQLVQAQEKASEIIQRTFRCYLLQEYIHYIKRRICKTALTPLTPLTPNFSKVRKTEELIRKMVKRKKSNAEGEMYLADDTACGYTSELENDKSEVHLDDNTTHGCTSESKNDEGEVPLDFDSTHGCTSKPENDEGEGHLDDDTTHGCTSQPENDEGEVHLDGDTTHGCKSELENDEGKVYLDDDPTHGCTSQPENDEGEVHLDDDPTHGCTSELENDVFLKDDLNTSSVV